MSDSTTEALAYIADNNGDGRYDEVLARVAEGGVKVGIMRFQGKGLDLLRETLAGYDAKLAGDAISEFEREALLKARSNLCENIAQAEAAVANPVIYLVDKGN